MIWIKREVSIDRVGEIHVQRLVRVPLRQARPIFDWIVLNPISAAMRQVQNKRINEQRGVSRNQ